MFFFRKKGLCRIDAKSNFDETIFSSWKWSRACSILEFMTSSLSRAESCYPHCRHRGHFPVLNRVIRTAGTADWTERIPLRPRKSPIQIPVTKKYWLRIPTPPAGPHSRVKAAWPSRKNLKHFKTLGIFSVFWGHLTFFKWGKKTEKIPNVLKKSQIFSKH